MRNEIAKQIDDLIVELTALRADMSWVPQIPNCSAQFDKFDCHSVEIKLPFNPTEIDRVRKIIESAGYKLAYERNAYDTAQYGTGYLDFEDGKGHEIKIDAETWRNGSICKRNKIGEKVQPVYELVCNAEMAQ